MAQNNSTLYFLSYNNYYNRIVKQEENLDSYLDYQVYEPLVCNFNPADGVDTEHIINTPYLVNGPEADYIVVANENNEIVSRWFIVEADRLRGGQYRLVLHRDLVVDYFEAIINAPAYVERAMCNTANNLIFNSENLLVNQIKQRETLLKDKSDYAWIVGYLAKNFNNDQDITITTATSGIYTPTISSKDKYEWDALAAKSIYSISSITFFVQGFGPNNTKKFRFNFGSNGGEYFDLGTTNEEPSYSDPIDIHFPLSVIGRTNGPNQADLLASELEKKQAVFANDTFSFCQSKVSSYATILKKNEIESALSESGLLLTDTDQNVFTVKISDDGYTNNTYTIDRNGGSLYTNLVNFLRDTDTITNPENYSQNLRLIGADVIYRRYTATINPSSLTFGSAKIFSSQVGTLKDQPYSMFAIPYPISSTAKETKLDNLGNSLIPNAELGLNMAMSICKTLGKENVYDLQLLPYCPIPELINEDGGIDLSDYLTLTDEGTYLSSGASTKSKALITPICFGSTGDGELRNYILWPVFSSFETIISNPIAVPTNNIDFKVEHETSFYRLNSPNYNGSFQFKATSNRGVDYFRISCTYKPYSPYIHIAPDFKGLYGADYNDARGLICGGNFSLPTITDAWESYQIQNKNFLNSFNRQIENMETVYDLQREQQRLSSGIGVATAGISGGASGAIVGAQFGGGIGAAIGGVAGAATGAMASAVGRKQDLRFLQLQQNEALSYTKDQFNLSLQNIQALPYSLNNISAYDINNKFFPFLEYFSCSDEEKEAVRSKITYRSMTVNAMGTIASYIAATPSYISAQLIRLDNLGDDYHVAAALANEIHQGVYI